MTAMVLFPYHLYYLPFPLTSPNNPPPLPNKKNKSRGRPIGAKNRNSITSKLDKVCGKCMTTENQTVKGKWYRIFDDNDKQKVVVGYMCKSCYYQDYYKSHYMLVTSSYRKTESCKHNVCIDQQRKVMKERPGIGYSKRFEFYNFCRDCRTFWPKPTRFCLDPDCESRLKTKISNGAKMLAARIKQKRLEQKQQRMKEEQEQHRNMTNKHLEEVIQ